MNRLAKESSRSAGAIALVLLLALGGGCGSAGGNAAPGVSPAQPPAPAPGSPEPLVPGGAANSAARINADMREVHESTPAGPGGFYWSSGPALGVAPPVGTVALAGMGQLTLAAGTAAPADARVQLRNFETWVLSASSGAWRRVQYSETVVGRFIAVGYDAESTASVDARVETEGGSSVRPLQGFIYRFRPASGATRSLIDPADIRAVFSTVQARLVGETGGTVDGAAGGAVARMLVNVGVEWFAELPEPASAVRLDQGGQAGQGRFAIVGSQWRASNFTTASAAQIDALTPPLVNSAAEGVAKAWRILPIGDSITAGTPRQSSYRRPLWNLLVVDPASPRIDLVGSRNGVNLDGGTCASPVDSPPDSDGRAVLGEFDQDHDGYWGWCTAPVTQRLQSVLPALRPDIALVHLGTNDIGQSTPAGIADSLGNLIASLRAQNPRIRVLIAQIIPYTGSGAERIELNQRIVALAASLDTAASPVVAVDQGSGFSAAADTYDGVHPNDAGEARMATRWHSALARFW